MWHCRAQRAGSLEVACSILLALVNAFASYYLSLNPGGFDRLPEVYIPFFAAIFEHLPFYPETFPEYTLKLNPYIDPTTAFLQYGQGLAHNGSLTRSRSCNY